MNKNVIIMWKLSFISEEDFKLRGHGDLFGTKQSGDMTFKIANIREDYKILLQAKKDSKEYLLDKNTDDDFLKKKLIRMLLLKKMMFLFAKMVQKLVKSFI